MGVLTKISRTLAPFVVLLMALLLSMHSVSAWGEEKTEETAEESVGPVLFNDETLPSSQNNRSIALTEANATLGWKAIGTCEWRIDDKDRLIIRPVFNRPYGTLPESPNFPWSCYKGDWQSTKIAAQVKSVEIMNCVYASSSLKGMFYGCNNLTSLNLSNLVTSGTTNMSFMFYGCSALVSLKFPQLDTSRVTNMYKMFYDCNSLTSLDLSKLDTSNVMLMDSTFCGCSALTSLDLSQLDMSRVTTMHRMFSGCSALTSLDLSKFDTSRVTNMSFMFSDCSALTSLSLYHFNTSNVTNMGDMFSGCSTLKSLFLSSFDTSNVTDMGSMFSSCDSLRFLDLSHFDTSKVTDMEGMFNYCKALYSVSVGDKSTFQRKLPQVKWINTKGQQFYPADIPVGVADTYTSKTTSTESYVSIKLPTGASTVLNVGDALQLSADVVPSSLTSSLTWTSSNEAVVSVDGSGKVSAKAAGIVTISAQAGDLSDSITVTVKAADSPDVAVESVELDKASLTLVGQETKTITAIVLPTNASYKNVVWSSSNESVATVNNKGVVEAKGKGEATITASSLDGKKSATCKVTVLNPPVSLSFGDMNSTLKIGETISVSFAGAGDLPGATEELTSPTWINSDAGFAELSADGFSASLTGLSVGKVTISVDAIYDGQHISASKEIEVVWNDPESITLNESKIHSLVGDDSFSLVSTVMPESASGYQVLWSSSNPDVVSVEQNGRVDIHKSGYAVITARAGAVFATCEVNINAKSIPAATDSDLKGYVLIDDPDLAKELDGLRLRISNNDRKSASEVKSAAVDSLGNGTTLADLYDIDLIDGNDDVHPWDSDSKSVSVYIALTDELRKLSSSNDLIVHYLSDDLSKRETKKTWIEGENLIFDTTHFSTYAVTASPIENKSPVVNNTNVSGDPKGSLPKTGDSSTVFILIVTSAILALASTLILATYRRRSLNQK